MTGFLTCQFRLCFNHRLEILVFHSRWASPRLRGDWGGDRIRFNLIIEILVFHSSRHTPYAVTSDPSFWSRTESDISPLLWNTPPHSGSPPAFLGKVWNFIVSSETPSYPDRPETSPGVCSPPFPPSIKFWHFLKKLWKLWNFRTSLNKTYHWHHRIPNPFFTCIADKANITL